MINAARGPLVRAEAKGAERSGWLCIGNFCLEGRAQEMRLGTARALKVVEYTSQAQECPEEGYFTAENVLGTLSADQVSAKVSLFTMSLG